MTFASRSTSRILVAVSVGAIIALFALPRGGIALAHPTRTSAQTLTAAFAENFSTLDPAIGYDAFSWTGEHAIFNGLLAYRNAPGRSGTKLIPDIASSMPAISKDGLFYTFHLRHDVHFAPPLRSLVTATDFKYSIERALSPHTTGAAMFKSAFWSPLAGVSAFWAKKAPHIKGIKVLNRFAIQFHLTSPDLAFLNVIAMPFADVVSQSWVHKEGKKFAVNPVGTGPYQLSYWHQNVNMLLVKNPLYYHRGLPHVPQVKIDFNVNQDLQVERAQLGQLDLPGDFVSSAEYLKLRNNAQYKSQLVTAPDIAIRYLAMNMQMSPFKGNLALRQAINMAIDKTHILTELDGRGVAMNGVLPPTMPGANPHFTYYAHNISKAKALVKKAHLKSGLTIPLLYDNSNSDYGIVVDAVISQLKQIGLTVTPRPVSDQSYYSLVYTPGKSAFSLGVWGEDYPDPSDFFDPILSCSASSNAAFFCNHAVDRLGNKARADRNPTSRFAIYRKMERMVMAQAPWAPIYDDEEIDFRGAAVKGFFIHPVWPFSYDQYQLK
ncbi:MAG TPA: ABC transporter substrate-binding protein [Chloroflexota bacterium]|jgi:ABC-type transport system substrate-binding protein|nr:ABC transporter substrate-binding protein [Chloroflexota bacterium]